MYVLEPHRLERKPWLSCLMNAKFCLISSKLRYIQDRFVCNLVLYDHCGQLRRGARMICLFDVQARSSLHTFLIGRRCCDLRCLMNTLRLLDRDIFACISHRCGCTFSNILSTCCKIRELIKTVNFSYSYESKMPNCKVYSFFFYYICNRKLTRWKQRMRRSWSLSSQVTGRRVNGVKMMFSKHPSDS